MSNQSGSHVGRLRPFSDRTPIAVLRLLGPAQRKATGYVFAGIVFGMIVEAISLGAVVPALMIVSGDSGAPGAMTEFLKWMNLEGVAQSRLILYAFVGLLLLYAVKAVVLVALSWQQARYIADVRQDIACRLASLYLRQPWTFHLQRNSAELIRNCTTEVVMFMNGFTAMLWVAAEAIVAVGLAFVVLVFEPIPALLVAVFLAGATWILHLATGARITRWGLQRQVADEQRLKWLQQGLGGAREVKMCGREETFLSHFFAAERSAAHATRMQDFAMRIPRLWYEVIAVCGVCVIGMVFVLQDVPPQEIIPRLGLFAVAAFRLMPSASRLVSAGQTMQFMDPALRVMCDELKVEPAAQPPRSRNRLPFIQAIFLENLSFQYSQAHAPAISDISFTISRGASIGIVGESGAGKSTLVDLLLGLLVPATGRIRVDDGDIADNLDAWQNCIGYVPQSIFLMDDTIRANVAFGVPPSDVDDSAVLRAIQAAQLHEFVATLPACENTFVGERGVRLSGGQRQRIGIARALYWDPPILVLDEATSSLDSRTEANVMSAVNALHGTKTLIIIAHRMSTVANCDTLLKLHRGRIVAHDQAVQPGP